MKWAIPEIAVFGSKLGQYFLVVKIRFQKLKNG
jgi:hypothetical protein